MPDEMVVAPPHYRTGRIEVIDILEDQFPTEPLLFAAGKYLCRCQHKGKLVQDLEKAIWYIQRRIEKEKAQPTKGRAISKAEAEEGSEGGD